MDARTHNECERCLLEALDALKPYIGEFDINIYAKKEGSLIDTLELVYHDFPFISTFISNIVSNIITSFIVAKCCNKKEISPMTASEKLTLIEKIKKGELTENEAFLICESDSKMKKYVSDYFSNALNNNSIQAIEATTKDDKNNVIGKSRIYRKDFSTHIIEEVNKTETFTQIGTTIRITSPVLEQNAGRLKWYGIYLEKNISFTMNDKEFLKQAYNNEIKFSSSTAITCDIIITHRILTDKNGLLKDKFEYSVLKVRKWYDGEIYQNGNKRYHKDKNQQKEDYERNLFNEDDFNQE